MVITENEQPVARLLPAQTLAQKHRQLGTLTGTVLYMAADFDAPLEDFKEYMDRGRGVYSNPGIRCHRWRLAGHIRANGVVQPIMP